MVASVQQADAAGIDCPFGWPAPFLKVLQASGQRLDPGLLESVDDRKPLSYRTTDLAVLERTERKVRPLSVSTNFLGATAMR